MMGSSGDERSSQNRNVGLARFIRGTIGSPFKGIIHDIKGRLPYYLSDWTDGWNYRVIPSITYMYFTNILPAIAFAQDMFDKTNNSYGVNEVLLASAMGGIVFGLFAGQPLCIVGVTGPVAIFNYTVYEIVNPKGIPYFPFMAWVYLWSMVMHFIIAALNWVNGLRYVTRFSCDMFGFFISVVYIQKGVQMLMREFDHSNGDVETTAIKAYLAIVIALLVMVFGMISIIIGEYSKLFKHSLRKFFSDYGLPLTVVFFSGFAFFPGRLKDAHLNRLNITESFVPTAISGGRTHGWFIHFWDINVGDVFLAIPFALLLTSLFYFDHNVSSLICQGSEFPLKKPASFHWDFFLLGITTGLAGILGIPAPNGLIPQAPLHTMSLCVWKYRRENENLENACVWKNQEENGTTSSVCVWKCLPEDGCGHKSDESNNNSLCEMRNDHARNGIETDCQMRLADSDRSGSDESKSGSCSPLPISTKLQPYIASVVEQRVSNLVQGLLILGTMSGPLLVVLGLLPKGVLAGLFWMMGLSGLMGNGVTAKLKYIFSDEEHIDPKDPLNKVRKKYLYLFVIVACLGAAGEVAITDTIAAVGFPAILIGLVGVGKLLPKIIPEPDMSILDGPTGSEFILRNLSSASWSANNENHEEVLPTANNDAGVELQRLEEGQHQRQDMLRRRSSHSGREVSIN
ncbi:Bor1p [Sugiyamaella lignohabitans]|uniref:Bor1p n=1 Tax=Sugiyamaella lignohabitans TaxID=796027 RepID=A0A167DQR0_9ASCO|nr:Bor1p [Sugiyamaella lignohabitans]ANB13179.1 Bor1p [Sugiyamaella lignohabitans]